MTDYQFDISSVLSNIINFWYLIPILLVSLFFKTPLGKYLFGTILVTLMINFKLDKKKYHLLKNVTLHSKNETIHIDHILVSQYGIFILETINVQGFIFGAKDQKIWTQEIYNKTKKFKNPLEKIDKKTKILESFLEINDNKVFSLIVFVGDSTFKTQMPENISTVGRFIQCINSKNEELFSPQEIKICIDKMNNYKSSALL